MITKCAMCMQEVEGKYFPDPLTCEKCFDMISQILERHGQIILESLNLLNSTKNIDTFVSRYKLIITNYDNAAKYNAYASKDLYQQKLDVLKETEPVLLRKILRIKNELINKIEDLSLTQQEKQLVKFDKNYGSLKELFYNKSNWEKYEKMRVDIKIRLEETRNKQKEEL